MTLICGCTDVAACYHDRGLYQWNEHTYFTEPVQFHIPFEITYYNEEAMGKILDALPDPEPCPDDTDGDGNCGKRYCPHCGLRGDYACEPGGHE